MMPYFEHLTDEQRVAVETSSVSAYVDAGPGSGKTLTIVARIVFLIRYEGVNPREIAALVFTRSAAEEIRSRLAVALGADVASHVTIDTFHGFVATHYVGPGYRVATEAEQSAAVRSLYEGPSRRPPRGRPSLTALRKAIVGYEATGFDKEHAPAIRIVRRRLLRAGLIPTWTLLPASAGTPLPRFHHVLVDEAQDVTPMEFDCATQIAGRGNLFAVGDERQAIMGWRGATGWPMSFVEEKHRLTKTFRFGPTIAEFANGIAARFGEEPIDGNPDIEDEVLNFDDDREFEREAALCRTNAQCEYFAEHEADGVEHVKRDPTADPFSLEADRFEDVWSRGKVVCSTVHSFKGREADHVVCTLDTVNVDLSEEEHRVLYVAVTRARTRLTLMPVPTEAPF